MDKKQKELMPVEENGNVRKKRERHKLSYYFTAGIFMSLLDRFTNFLYESAIGGFFGRLFTAYSSLEDKARVGCVREYVLGGGEWQNYMRKIRGWLSEKIENGFVLWLFRVLSNAFISTPLKIYGNYLLTFGLYTVFAYFVRRFTEFTADADYGLIIFGAVLVVVAMPLLVSRDSLGGAIGSSRSARAIFSDCFGFRDESFEIAPKATRLRANMAIILGMISGVLAVVIDPMYVILTFFVVVAAALIIVTPEIGILLSLFALPFFSFANNPSLLLGLLVSLTVVGMVVKLIRGKRSIRIEAVDVMMLFFIAVLFLSGAISTGGAASLAEALLALMLILIYFLVANMMRSELWIKRCVLSLVSSATAVAIIGIFEYFVGNLNTEWLDIEYFPEIAGRVVSVFDNSNVLAFYLVMIFPFALDLIFKCKTRGETFLSVFSTISIVLCVVFTYSRGAWVAMLIATLAYLLIKARRSFKIMVGLCFFIPVLPLVLPTSVVSRFMSIGDMADSSTFYRVYTWKGATRAALDNFFSGIGYGSEAFKKMYPSYSYAGIESAEHAHSLYLQIFLAMGVVGFAIFLLTMLVYSQKALEYIKAPESKRSMGLVSAALTSTLAALVMGAFDYIFYNYRIFFLFFAIMGIAVAAVRVGKTKMKKENIKEISNDVSAEAEIF